MYPSVNPINGAVTIRTFEPGDETSFRQLNEEWIGRHFVLEEKDEQTFADPQKYILKAGGAIWLAVQDGRSIGCCALLAMAEGEFEVAKMAVAPESRGQGIGRKLLERVIEDALGRGARRLYLETNRKLVSAIRLYESLGFRHLPAERITPSAYARADVYMELLT
jgi:putative acetyltransferase